MSNDKIRVLVVDDDAMVLRATSRALSSAGFEVVSTLRASAVVDYHEQSAYDREKRYHVIVSDLEMPGTSGDELCCTVQVIRPIPFILLSGSPIVFERALSCGATAAFLKPVGPAILAAAVRDAAESGSS